MDAEQFDAFTRTLELMRSRRSALSVILMAVGALAISSDLGSARKRKRKRRRQGGHQCIDCSDRSLRRSADLKGCDLAGRDLSGADLRSADLDGACLQHANLAAANLRSADLEGADLRGADLTAANLDRADIRGWQAAGAIFCRTIMPDGSLNNASCPPGGGGTCLVLSEACNPHGGPACCDYQSDGAIACLGTNVPFLFTCQSLCQNDDDCYDSVGTTDIVCDPFFTVACSRPNLDDPHSHCCFRSFCDQNSDCESGLCCTIAPETRECCLAGERCLIPPLGCGR